MLSVLSLTGTSIDTQDEHHMLRNSDRHNPSSHDHEEDDDLINDQGGMSKAEIRKSNKPIMEKRRRARINTCLNELKSLILEALKKDPSRHSKLEKADILEMTVKHLQTVQRQQLALAVAHDPSVLEKFKGGFTECAQEITRYISRIDGVDAGIRQRLMQHLSHCTNSLNATTPLSFTAMAGLPLSIPSRLPPPPHPLPPPPPSQGDLNNNSQARLLHKLVAARLAAAGDTAGAALLLQGGLSLLARGSPNSTSPRPLLNTSALQPQRTNNQQPKLTLQNVNEGASSSSRQPSTRVSAFTAVKRSSSPPRIMENHMKLNPNLLSKSSKILTPTAVRPVPCEEQRKTLVQAQVSLQPVRNGLPSSGNDTSTPIDFSFRSGTKRPLEEQISSRPIKIIKIEDESLSNSKGSSDSPRNADASSSSSAVASSAVAPSSIFSTNGTATSPPEKPLNRSTAENHEGDEKDMWRPW